MAARGHLDDFAFDGALWSLIATLLLLWEALLDLDFERFAPDFFGVCLAFPPLDFLELPLRLSFDVDLLLPDLDLDLDFERFLDFFR